jgi:hypothetical protein
LKYPPLDVVDVGATGAALGAGAGVGAFAAGAAAGLGSFVETEEPPVDTDGVDLPEVSLAPDDGVTVGVGVDELLSLE